jgi:hypothetical protein
MQCLTRTAALAVGLLASGSASADTYNGAAPYYTPYSPYYSSSTGYPYSYPYYGYTYPAYTYNYGYPAYSYGYPAYGWYAGTPYAWPQTSWTPRNPWAPYSRTNANWVPYAGRR